MVTQMQRELGDQEVVVTRVLGSGGSGVVYQGTWRGLTVAVKTLVFTVLPMQPMTRRQQRAMTEAAICRTLHHPNIVATYAYELQSLQALGSRQPSQANPGACASSSSVHSNSSGGEGQGQGTQSVLMRGSDPPAPIESVSTATEYKLYIIQEFCNGGTLRSAVDEGMLHDMSGGTPRPVMSHILELALDIAAGMAHVHSRNIVHGDLTPANVLLRISEDKVSRFTAKVADFGLSWKLASGQEHISNARQGTGFYISPEVLHVGIMSKAADAFSFGMLLHEMYHGTPVWRRGSQGMAAAAVAAMQRPGLDQLAWSPSCSPEFKNLITDCLASDPQARPSFVRIVERLMLLQHSTMQHNNSQLATRPTAPCPDPPLPSADVPSPPALSPPDIAAAAAAMVGAQPGARSIHAAAAAAVATAAAAGLRPGPATLAVGHTSGLSLAGYNKHGLGEALAPVAEEGEPLTPMASQRSDSIRSSASFLPPAGGDPAKCSSGELLRGGSAASTGAGGPVLDTLSSLCNSGSLGKAVGSGVLVRELSFGSRVGLVGTRSLGDPSFALGSGSALTSINLDDGGSSRLQEVEGREGLDGLVGREGGEVGAGAEGGQKEGEGEAVGVWELGVARDLPV
ncbi:kinase-like domain-containing protein [Haematococcus lacustris]